MDGSAGATELHAGAEPAAKPGAPGSCEFGQLKFPHAHLERALGQVRCDIEARLRRDLASGEPRVQILYAQHSLLDAERGAGGLEDLRTQLQRRGLVGDVPVAAFERGDVDRRRRGLGRRLGCGRGCRAAFAEVAEQQEMGTEAAGNVRSSAGAVHLQGTAKIALADVRGKVAVYEALLLALESAAEREGAALGQVQADEEVHIGEARTHDLERAV